MPGLKTENDSDAESTPASSEIMNDAEMREFQKSNTLRALKQANWKVSGSGGAAELLGVKPTTLADRIRTFNIKKPGRE
jgi:transcriptional regulator with GAF, ATPase, and Fis domain